ncbi:hypothetical protein [Mycobacterium colombiense]|uniref:hypothetical protein n=1 Tax=Mycobacterium colombiense TaxID=339268 RepID=UPI0039E903D6
MSGEQVDGIRDSADGGVQGRGDVIDQQRRYFLDGEVALVDRSEEFMGHAAGQHIAVAYDAACEAQHL